MALPAPEGGLFAARLAFLPPGDDPDTLIAHQGAPAMARLIDAAMPLSDLIWRA